MSSSSTACRWWRSRNVSTAAKSRSRSIRTSKSSRPTSAATARATPASKSCRRCLRGFPKSMVFFDQRPDGDGRRSGGQATPPQHRITGIDGSPEAEEALKGDTMFVGSAAQSPFNVGAASVKAGYDLFQGKKPEKDLILIAPTLVNRDNIGRLQGLEGQLARSEKSDNAARGNPALRGIQRVWIDPVSSNDKRSRVGGDRWRRAREAATA